MSNIKKNFFNPGSNKTIAKVDPKAKLPAPKKNTTFDPNYKSRFVSRMTHTLTKENIIKCLLFYILVLMKFMVILWKGHILKMI